MNRYWCSWWSGYYEDEGCTKPSFQIWISGNRDRDEERDQLSICAVIDANNEEEILKAISFHFPDYEIRFIEQVADDYIPSNRFNNFKNLTKILN